jgi:hypothetical protein
MYNHDGERQRPNMDSNPSPMFISKKIGLLWNFYISVCIRNCRVLNFLEFDDELRGTKFRDIMNGGLNP